MKTTDWGRARRSFLSHGLVPSLLALGASIALAAPGDPFSAEQKLGQGGPTNHDDYFEDFGALIRLDGGNVAVSWNARDNSAATPISSDGDDWGGFFKIYGPTGSVITATPVAPYLDINAGGTGFQDAPLLIPLANGSFAATWNSAGGPGDTYDPGFGGGDAWTRVYTSAGVAAGGTVHVNENDPNGVPDGQYPAGGVGLTGGNFAIVWGDENDATGNTDDYFVRVFSPTGAAVNPSVQMGSSAVHGPLFQDFGFFGNTGPRNGIAALSDGGFVVAWRTRDSNNDGTGTSADGAGYGAFFQVFNADGTARSTVQFPYNDINPTGLGSQNTPIVAALTGGGFAIVWNSAYGPGDVGNGSNSTSGGDVYTRVFSNAGAAVSSTVRVNDTLTADEQTPDGLIALTGGGFAVAWNDDENALGNTDDPYVRAFNANGTAASASVQLGGAAAESLFQDFGNLAALSDGGFAAGWRTRDSNNDGTGTSADGGGYGAFIQVFNANGTARSGLINPYFDINPMGTGSQNTPIIASIAGGGFAATWNSAYGPGDTGAGGNSTSGGDSYARLYDNSGTALGGTKRTTVGDPSGSVDEQAPRAIVESGTGNFAVVTRDENDATNNKDDHYIRFFSGVAAAPVETTVTSINRKDSTPTNAGTVRWDVVFAASVTGVGTGNFATVNGGSVTGSSVTGVTGSGTTYVVTANTGSGSGTLGLNFANDTGVSPATSNEPFTGQVYTIDKTPPAAPSTPDLIAASDTGASNTDNITADKTPTLTGTGENGSTVTLKSSIAGNVGTFVVAGGNWTITTPVLADGTHSFTATAADALGNSSAPSGVLSVVIDTTIAPPTGLDLIAASDSGASTTDDITMVTKPKIAGDAETGSLVTLISSLNGVVGSGSANSPFLITTSMLSNGTHQITGTATDLAGNTSGPSAPLQIVVDTVSPIVASAKDLVVNFPLGAAPLPVTYPTPTATDNVSPANPPVACVPPSGANFPLGVTPVTCTATDTAGNMASITFDVIALEEQASPGERFLDAVSLRGDAATGPGVPVGATIFNIYRAHLGNGGTVVFDAALSGAGTNNTGVFAGPITGPHPALAVKGTAAPGGGLFGAFSNLAVNGAGSTSFQSAIGSNPSLFSGGMAAAARGGIAPTGGSETYIVLQKPALASDGSLLVAANLQLGSGAGVTVSDDTLVVRGSSEVLAREGAPSSLAATAYGHLHPRVVASDGNGRFAFSAFLLETPFDPSDNTALFTGVLGGGPPQAIIREGEVAAGTGGTTFSIFMGEAVNSAGEVVLRANVAGTGVSAANNEGLWTTSGNAAGPPVLVAREGAVAPCLPDSLAAFERFASFHLGDDGAVCFFAYLKDATATPAVHSGNDGSLWRWKNGELHLIAREGGIANNTAGAIIASIGTVSCNSTGGIAFEITLVNGIGDTTSSTNQAVFLDRGVADPAPLLVLRRGDTFDLGGSDVRTVVGLGTSSETNVGGATGGYGRAMNDAGEILLNLTLSGNTSGIFVLGMPAAPPPP